MIDKEPTIQVPASLFLELVRIYKQVPQEWVDRKSWLEADQLERRAERKHSEHIKKMRVI